jgi:hypothetical protein
VVICPHQALFLALLPGKKKISSRGVSHAQSLICFVLLYFIFACIVLSKTQKNCVILLALIIVICFVLLLLAFSF